MSVWITIHGSFVEIKPHDVVKYDNNLYFSNGGIHHEKVQSEQHFLELKDLSVLFLIKEDLLK